MPATEYSRALLLSRMGDAVERILAAMDALSGDENLEAEEDAEHDGREPEDRV